MSKQSLSVREVMALAARRTREGNTESAKSLYHKALAEDPTNKKAKKALKALQRDVKNQLSAADFDRVTQLLSQGKGDAALREVRILCKHHPEQPALHNLHGVVLNSTGDTNAAVEAFRQALDQEPAYSEALSNYAATLTKLERYQEALPAFQELVNRGHADAASHLALAKALRGSGQIDNAVKALQRAIKLQPAFPDAFVNLGNILNEQGERDKAIASYENALAIDSKNRLALGNLATTYNDAQQFPQAIAAYRRQLEHYPEDASALLGIGSALLFSGDRQGAVPYFERSLASEPENAVAQHLLGAASGVTPVDGNVAYARAVFDSYARSFEETLTNILGYSFPQQLPALLENLDGSDAWYPNALDIGCGTGLVGPQIRSYCERLVGVDVSKKMLKQAEEKAVYDELLNQDAVSSLSSNSLLWDLVVCADVLVYLGKLDELFTALAIHCQQNARIVVTTETFDGEGYELRQSGRFAHSANYVSEVAAAAGLTVVEQQSISLRKEDEAWLSGNVFVLGKS